MKEAKKGATTTFLAPPPSPSATWQCIVPKKIKLPRGKKPFSAEVKLMTLSNAQHGSRREGKQSPYFWGGAPNFTKLETEAINALRADRDNINTLVFCCMDPRNADIYVYYHECDPTVHGTYKFHPGTFKANNPKEYPRHGFGVPSRHRSKKAIQAWTTHMQAWCGQPLVAVLHLNRAGVEDDCFEDARPVLAPGAVHLYGLCVEDGDSRLANARKFLSTRASVFDLPEIGDDFIETLKGKESTAKVKAFLNLFDGASNKAIGDFGEAIAVDILLASGAALAVKHPTTNWHYDLTYAM